MITYTMIFMVCGATAISPTKVKYESCAKKIGLLNIEDSDEFTDYTDMLCTNHAMDRADKFNLEPWKHWKKMKIFPQKINYNMVKDFRCERYNKPKIDG